MECGTEDDIWCSEADDGLSFGDLAGPDDRPCTVDDSGPVEKCSGDCGGWCSDPKCPRKTKRQQKEREPEIERHWLDPASLRNERARLNSELSQIHSEFESLLWSEWSQMSTGGRSFDKPRRRRTQPKIDGHSPLKEVMSLDDIKTPPKPFAFFHPDSDDSSIDDLSLSPSDSPTSDAASITSTLTNTSVTTPRDSPVTSPNGSPPSEQTKRRLWTEWSDRADGTCPLTNLAFRSSGTQQLLRPSSHLRSQSWPAGEKQETALAFHKQEPPMLSDEWMRNLQELTMSECAVHSQPRGEVEDPVEDMLPDWGT